MQDAGPFRLRELWWRARARQLEEWDHTVWLGWTLLAAWCKNAPGFEELHPLRNQQRRRTSVPKGQMAPRGKLPKQLTEEEKREAFAAWERKQRHGRQR